MTQDREALAVTREQALEALESLDDFARMNVSVDPVGPRETLRRFIESAALAQQEAAEPVGFHDKDQPEGIAWCPGYPDKLRDITPLYTTPPAPQPAGAGAIPAGFALVPLRPNRAMERVMQEEEWQWADLLAAAGTVSEEDCEAAARSTPTPAAQGLTDAQIRAVFLANGFTIKEGCDDLKPYVYQAARALLALSTQQQEQAS